MTHHDFLGSHSCADAPALRGGCAKVRVVIGWITLCAVGVLLTSSDATPRGVLPWPAAWALFLPSLLAVCTSMKAPDATSRAGLLHLLLMFPSISFLYTVFFRLPPAPPVPGCGFRLAGEWLSRADGIYCPNIFEHRWGEIGMVVPVAAAVIVTALGHFIVAAFNRRRVA